jgi:DNA-binding GntR family transcriptional regulator
MNVHFNRSRMLRLVADFNWDTIFAQHGEIVVAIKEKKPELADELMQEHLLQAVIDKEFLKRNYPMYFK